MRELESYINAIVAGLGIGKQKKKDLADEFRDHLESLKAEYIQNGFSEVEAMKRAMERFGESCKLNKMLQKSAGFRNWSNILLGAVVTLVVMFLCYLPMYGLTVAYRNYIPAAGVSALLFLDMRSVLSCAAFFIPIGYFLPVVFNRVYRLVPLVSIFSILGILAGVYCNIALTHYVNIVFLLAYGATALLGGAAGYLLLLGVNKIRISAAPKAKISN